MNTHMQTSDEKERYRANVLDLVSPVYNLICCRMGDWFNARILRTPRMRNIELDACVNGPLDRLLGL